jgi:ribosomal protein L40E
VEPPEPSELHASESFRPWHFFLLASLVTATAAVMLSRQSTPEHLVLISLTIISAGLAAAGFYRTLAPLAAPDQTMFSEPLSGRARAALEREKMLVLRSIKELEFDRAMGKLSTKDFEEMSQRLRTRAIALMKQLDEGDTGYREVIERELRARLVQAPGSGFRAPGSDLASPADGAAESAAATATVVAGTCASCGITSEQDATFCRRCGAKL